MKYYLAIDIGASSGRHIVGWRDGEGLHTQEVYRFPNGMETRDGHLTWNIDHLEAEVMNGIGKAVEQFGTLASLAIDTWGVDYVLLRHGAPIRPCYAYRDGRTENAVREVHEIVPFAELYARTGIQFQAFNTVYQLWDDKQKGRLEGADSMLMIPEYLSYRLTGTMAREYTNATTTGMVNAVDGQFDREIIEKLGLPERLFPQLRHPGTAVGEYRGIPVLLCASHDTASAVEGIPMEGEGLFLSSGTWSLLGAKAAEPVLSEESRSANFTNEGGVGYIRLLKNIMGLWILQNLQKKTGYSFDDITRMARESGEKRVFDVNDQRFSAPQNMKWEILGALGGDALTDGALFGSVHHSLAHCYGKAVAEIETIAGRTWDRLYIVGGGAKNGYLNELTRQYTGKEVVALPIEATALGNLKIQMEALS